MTSSRNYYAQQQRVVALALRAVRRTSRRGVEAVAREAAGYQAAIATLSIAAVAAQAQEQALNAPPSAPVVPSAFAGWTSAGARLLDYLARATSTAQLERMVVQQVRDAGRGAAGVAITARPSLAGHIRYLNPPSCARCTILAGRFYRWSDGFLRHDRCDCVMVPTNEEPAAGLIGNPDEAYRRGLVTDLTEAERKALDAGADMSQVVNVRSKKAGLTVAGLVLERPGTRFTPKRRLTPEGIYALASDRDEALALLQRHGYVR